MPPSAHDAATPTPGDPSRPTVLYIEDNPSNIALVQRLLVRRPAVRLLVATEGSEGVEIAVKVRPDLILVDMHLPDTTGDVVVRQLQAAPATQHLPVVVLSGDARPERREQVLQLGAVDFVLKPFELSHFFAVVDRYTTP